MGLSDDPLLYTGGGRTELDLDLLFDVSLAGSSVATRDVRDLTRAFWDLAENAGQAMDTTHPDITVRSERNVERKGKRHGHIGTARHLCQGLPVVRPISQYAVACADVQASIRSHAEHADRAWHIKVREASIL